MSLQALKRSNANYQDTILYEEVWKPIVGYEETYEVSSLGKVRSLPRIVKGKGDSYQERPGIELRPDKSTRYERVTLFKNNRRRRELIHRLVASTFVSNSLNKPEVNHIDGNRDNNRSNNLEWVTSSENTLHSFENGLQIPLRGSEVGNSKLNLEVVSGIRMSGRDPLTRKELAKRYKVSYSTIYDIQIGRRWAWTEEGDIRGL